MNWPIGSGKEFQGVYDRHNGQLLFFSGVSGKNRADKLEIKLADPKVGDMIGAGPARAADGGDRAPRRGPGI